MTMHCSFRAASRARRVEPERGIVAARRRDIRSGARRLKNIFKIGPGPAFAGNEENVLRFFGDPFPFLGEIASYEYRTRIAVFEYPSIIVGGHQGVQRNRHDARLDRSQKNSRKIPRIEKA